MKRLLPLLLLGQPLSAAELYLQVGAAYQLPHGRCFDDNYTQVYCSWDRTLYVPLLAHAEIGVEHRAGRFTLGAFARHESLPMRSDFGVNQLGVRVRITLAGSK